MRNEPNSKIDEADLDRLRVHPDAVAMITALLGANEMTPTDRMRTEQEVREYVNSGGPGEAHALIHDARMRRELWRREQDEDELPPTG
jgi:hypothetical protein